MLCLIDSIRDDDPSGQYLLRVLEDAGSLTALILAAWQVARVLAVQLVETVLDERARQPTAWPPCPACGASVRSKGVATRHRRGQQRPRPARWSPGGRSAGSWLSWGISTPSSRVSGSKRCARASGTLPRWSGSVLVVEGCGAYVTRALRPLPRASWTSGVKV